MIYLAAAMLGLGFAAGGVHLVMHDHPWFGLLLFLMTAFIRASSTGNAAHPQPKETDDGE